ncbi:unnamed protein product [Adineta ricciae]|uniref:Uncharacterized protein n=1 Tax=Adineta ricciae TaxID=249248 RepID=A0A815H6L9_ADIRI|nr:unnamed protein product [Adineta ricciae]CAF1347924.1 unnamed protein product [Adineta ricciae]
MFANRARFPGPPIGNQIPIGSPEYHWKTRWPSLISSILGGVIIFFSVIIIVLEIALLGVIGDVTGDGVYFTGVGIWCGVFTLAAGILILIIRWMKSIRRWSFIAFIASIVGAMFSIIELGINAKRVDLARSAGLFDFSDSRVKSLGGLPAAQLAFGIVLFLLCLAFIALWIYVKIQIKRQMSRRQFGPRRI